MMRACEGERSLITLKNSATIMMMCQDDHVKWDCKLNVRMRKS